MDEPKVGGWINAYCTTCRDLREHILVAKDEGGAPAKVECTSCHKQHKYRTSAPVKGESASAAAPSAPRTPRPRRAAAPESPPPAVDLSGKIMGRTAVRYDPAVRFTVDDVVEHPTFGVGVVTALPGMQKVEILFPSGARLLQHDRASQRATLTRPPPRDDTAGPRVSDAPPPRLGNGR